MTTKCFIKLGLLVFGMGCIIPTMGCFLSGWFITGVVVLIITLVSWLCFIVGIANSGDGS